MAEISTRDIASVVVADLNDVSASLQLDVSGTTDALSMLTHSLGLAVRSYRGMELSTYVSDLPVTVTAFQPLVQRGDIVTSLRLPLETLPDGGLGSELVVYAGRAGALVDLAADLAYALRVSPDRVFLDDHREPTTLRSGVSGVRELSVVSRAIGVLLDSDGSISAAQATLRRRAAVAGVDVHTAAMAVLEEAVSAPDAR